MKKLFFAACALLMTASFAHAQSTHAKTHKGSAHYDTETSDTHERTPEERAEAIAKKLMYHLDLTEEQYAQVREVALNQAKDLEKIKAMRQENRQAARAEMQRREKSTDGEMREILGEKQYNMYLEFKEEQKKKRMDKMQQRRDAR